MRYVIETDGDVSEAMTYLDARDDFMTVTGQFIPKTEVEGAELTVESITIRPASVIELCIMDEDGRLNVDAVIDDYPSERLQIAFDRAMRECDTSYPEDDDDFSEAMHEHLLKMAAGDVLEFCEKEGAIFAESVDDKGHFRYSKVKKKTKK